MTGARRVAEAVAERGGPMLVYASSLHVYGPGLTGEVDAHRPYGPQSDLAHLSKIYAELCLGLHAARAAFDLADPAPRDRLRAEPGRARTARVADGGRQVSPAGRSRGSAARSTTAGRRRSASSTSRTRPASCSSPTPACVPTWRRRRSRSRTSPRLARGEDPADEPAFTLQSPVRVPAPIRGVPPAARREAPRHRRRAASSARVSPTCWRSAATRSFALARPDGATARARPAIAIVRIDAGDPAARDLLAGLRCRPSLRGRSRPGSSPRGSRLGGARRTRARR